MQTPYIYVNTRQTWCHHLYPCRCDHHQLDYSANEHSRWIQSHCFSQKITIKYDFACKKDSTAQFISDQQLIKEVSINEFYI